MRVARVASLGRPALVWVVARQSFILALGKRSRFQSFSQNASEKDGTRDGQILHLEQPSRWQDMSRQTGAGNPASPVHPVHPLPAGAAAAGAAGLSHLHWKLPGQVAAGKGC